MKTTAIIAEYNPFHNGHLYHLKEAKAKTNADFILILMSGNFVQRGECACFDKYTRAKLALQYGADLVLELPVCYATASAFYFAQASIALLSKLHIVDFLCFGSESASLTDLQQIAALLQQESPSFTAVLKNFLKQGDSFPVAREKAFLASHKQATVQNTASFFQHPNDILGIEYCRALAMQHSSIQPVCIPRTGCAHGDSSLVAPISSATAIRKQLHVSPETPILSKVIPPFAYQTYQNICQTTPPLCLDDFSAFLFQQLRQSHFLQLDQYCDVSDAIAARIAKQKGSTLLFCEWITSLKTKTYTRTRIQRALLHILLQITKSSFSSFIQHDFPCYCKPLAMKQRAKPLLRHIKQHAEIPIISKLSHAEKQLSALEQEVLSQDLFATDLYRYAYYQKLHLSLQNDYTHGFCIIP